MVNTFHTHKPRSSTFVNHLLKKFWALHIRCAFVGNYPAYIAGVLSTYYYERLRVSQLCIAKTDSPF